MAFTERQNYPSSNTMAAIVPLFMRPMSLAVVILDPFSVNVLHFLPTLGLMEMKIRHSSDDIDYVELILPFQNSPFLRELTTRRAGKMLFTGIIGRSRL